MSAAQSGLSDIARRWRRSTTSRLPHALAGQYAALRARRVSECDVYLNTRLSGGNTEQAWNNVLTAIRVSDEYKSKHLAIAWLSTQESEIALEEGLMTDTLPPEPSAAPTLRVATRWGRVRNAAVEVLVGVLIGAIAGYLAAILSRILPLPNARGIPGSEQTTVPITRGPRASLPDRRLLRPAATSSFLEQSATTLREGSVVPNIGLQFISPSRRDVACATGRETKLAVAYASEETLNGQFVVSAVLDYTWGWSEVGVGAASDQFDSQGRIVKGELLDLFMAGSNSSNNLRRIYRTVGGNYQEAETLPGKPLSTVEISRGPDSFISIQFEDGSPVILSRLEGPVKVVAINQCGPEREITAVRGIEILVGDKQA